MLNPKFPTLSSSSQPTFSFFDPKVRIIFGCCSVFLIVAGIIEVCPLQDEKNMDNNNKEKIGFLRLQVVICINIFFIILNYSYYIVGSQ
jgi:glucose uptake protein GlcU